MHLTSLKRKPVKQHQNKSITIQVQPSLMMMMMMMVLCAKACSLVFTPLGD